MSGSQPVPSKRVEFWTKPLAFVVGLKLFYIVESKSTSTDAVLALTCILDLSAGFLKTSLLVVVQIGSFRFYVGRVTVDLPYLWLVAGCYSSNFN